MVGDVAHIGVLAVLGADLIWLAQLWLGRMT